MEMEVGCIYEFEPEYDARFETIIPEGLNTWPMLGILRGPGEIGDFEFTMIAGETPVKYDSVSVNKFRFLKRVLVQDLPLYINWKWRTEEFTRLLKGGG